ncbi:hemolysin III family protein [Conexibacter sp. SYSU D00693]|uniref:PAQR family membrane homeostasis protein TrhA n=1 Tax=Conexibacter sp. SYSU D00693 TaxID=2812560 RepID=UPI00196A3CC9|nr:hemolysin III family protein [Conexibacter sp. SYSU D00693]
MDALDIPRLRGALHLWSAAPAAAAAITLLVLAPHPDARAACAVYGVGLVALFAGSALYHRWPGDLRWKPLLRRIDHSTIFVFIAASTTPPAVLLLDGTARTGVLLAVWLGAAAGVLLSVAWIDAPRWLQTACYLALGWAAVSVMDDLFSAGGVAVGVLFVTGGVLYSAGAIAYALQRPDPWPSVFGYHEVFHLLVTAAAVVHYVAIALVVL